MNGTEDLPKNAKESLEIVDSALAEYEAKIGISAIKFNDKVEKYLSYPAEQIRKLTVEEREEASIMLAQYAIYIQKQYNDNISKANWAEDMLKLKLADEISSYKAPSYEERRLLAIRHNEYLTKLEKIRSYANNRAQRLNFIASRVEYLSRTFMSKGKRYHNE